MVRRLNPLAHSTQTFKPPRLPPTSVMMDQMMHELNAHQRKGITLQAIKKFVVTTYGSDGMTARRYDLIKKSLKQMLLSGLLINVTGKGLRGHFRLRNVPTSRRARKTLKPERSRESAVFATPSMVLDSLADTQPPTPRRSRAEPYMADNSLADSTPKSRKRPPRARALHTQRTAAMTNSLSHESSRG